MSHAHVEIIEEQNNYFLGGLAPLSYIPRAPEYLVPREAKYHELLQQLDTEDSAVLIGQGGQGKTTLAIRYAKENKNSRYPGGCYFMDCSSPEDFYKSCQDLGAALKVIDISLPLDQLWRGIMSKLQSDFFSERLILFVYDNVGVDFQVLDYLPPERHHLLFTTRSDRGISNFSSVCVEDFSLEEAVDYLKHSFPNEDDALIKRICDSVYCFPIALRQIAQYVLSAKPRKKLADIEQYIDKSSAHFLKYKIGSNQQEKVYYNIVSQAIKNLGRESGEAQRLLFSLVFLSPKNIPEKIISSYFSEDKQENINAVIKLLREYSFIVYSLEGKEDVFSMHPLSQEVILYVMANQWPYHLFFHLYRYQTFNMIANIFDSDSSSVEIDTHIANLAESFKRFLSENKSSNSKRIFSWLPDNLFNNISYSLLGLSAPFFIVGSLPVCFVSCEGQGSFFIEMISSSTLLALSRVISLPFLADYRYLPFKFLLNLLYLNSLAKILSDLPFYLSSSRSDSTKILQIYLGCFSIMLALHLPDVFFLFCLKKKNKYRGLMVSIWVYTMFQEVFLFLDFLIRSLSRQGVTSLSSKFLGLLGVVPFYFLSYQLSCKDSLFLNNKRLSFYKKGRIFSFIFLFSLLFLLFEVSLKFIFSQFSWGKIPIYTNSSSEGNHTFINDLDKLVAFQLREEEKFFQDSSFYSFVNNFSDIFLNILEVFLYLLLVKYLSYSHRSANHLAIFNFVKLNVFDAFSSACLACYFLLEYLFGKLIIKKQYDIASNAYDDQDRDTKLFFYGWVFSLLKSIGTSIASLMYINAFVNVFHLVLSRNIEKLVRDSASHLKGKKRLDESDSRIELADKIHRGAINRFGIFETGIFRTKHLEKMLLNSDTNTFELDDINLNEDDSSDPTLALLA